MRALKIIPGALVGLLFVVGPALSQETVLSGILSRLIPEARVSWSSGVSRGGAETYEGLFVGRGDLRLRAERVTVTPEGAVARVEAQGVVVNLGADDAFSLEIGSVATSLSAPLLNALRGVDGVPDLCRIASVGTEAEVRGLRTLRNVRQEGARLIRSEMTADRVRLLQEVTPEGAGCAFRVSFEVTDAQEVRSDKSGTRVDALELRLSLPGNLETLASDGAPPLRAALSFSGLLRRVPGGASVALAQRGSAEAELAALSAVPALTAYLRTRNGTASDRAGAVIGALVPGELRASATVEGSTVLAEALVPADRISGLSRASLTSVIGTYEAQLRSRSGQVSIRVGSDLVGVGRTALELNARLSGPDPDAPTLDLLPGLEPFLPRAQLETATLRHQDRGLLRAIELITGSPVSVLAAIFLQDGVGELPEPWRPAARRAASEAARFLSMTTSGEGAEIALRTPTDLSVLETYRLLTLRPELADRLISSEIRAAPPG